MNGIIKKDKSFYIILKGFLISLLVSIVFIWIYALILVKTNIKENTITPVIIIISGISILIGSSISCVNINKKGIIKGACIGGLYFINLYILSSIALCGFSFNIKSLIMIAVGIILGGIGGIIGVNIKN